ncbi:MAG: hypothetical protein J0M12_10220, partial [Deltaproteobacteria bacterium]|nr:hypothetical protein [Deltaproteobacteria bacterium]
KGEGFEVSRRIVEKFHEDVTSTGAKFLVVYLPNKVNLERSADNTEYAGSALVNSLSAKMKLVDPTQDLLNRASLGSVADLYNGHYTPTANQIIALSISKEIGKSPSTR